MQLRILIMDDINAKAQTMENVIREIFQRGEDVIIDLAGSIHDGRSLMYKYDYDLLLLDMVMPEHPGDDNDQSAGIEYLGEIEANQNIHQPLQIIGITMYEEEYGKLQEQFKDKLWYLLFYSEKDNGWKKQLRNKVIQLQRIKDGIERSILMRNHYDVGVICALPEEFTAIREVFGDDDWEQINIPGAPYQFYSAVVNSNLRDIRVVLACANRPGNASASTLAATMYYLFTVDELYMAGIMASMDKADKVGKLEPGDVVIGEAVLNYANAKVLDAQGNQDRLAVDNEIEQPQASNEMLSKATALITDTTLRVDLDQSIKDEGYRDEEHPVNIVKAKVASGPYVLASEELKADIRRRDRKLRALDMECNGLYLTASLLHKKALWIKAVSDNGDKNKNDDYHKAAAYTSAAVIYSILREIG